MRVLLLGGTGQVGRAILEAAGPEMVVLAPPRGALDLACAESVSAALSMKPDIVVNAAAYTAVDAAEDDPRAAFAVNCGGPGRLAATCATRGIPMIHLSTDYVFEGTKAGPYVESDPPGPVNIYGVSKLEGEQAVRDALREHLILRTSWVYGAHGRNFVKTILDRATTLPALRIVDDQRGCPTAAVDIASAILTILRRYATGDEVRWGTYHYAGAGEVSWFQLAEAAIESARPWLGAAPALIPIATRNYAARARRPANSTLDCRLFARTFGIAGIPWRTSLSRVVDDIGMYVRSEAVS